MIAEPVDSEFDEKLRVIQQLKLDPLFPKACFELVDFIATPTAKDPAFHTSQLAICRHLFGVEGDHYEVEDEHKGHVRRLIRRTRDELTAAALRPEARVNAYSIRFEKGDRSKGVSLTFVPNRRKRRPTVAPRDAVNGGAALLWQRMLEASKTNTIYLVYDTPVVGLQDASMEREGRWAGSGEVAAGFCIAECLCNLRRTVQVKRWRDLDHRELTGGSECLIMLGNSFNPWLTRLRSRDVWTAHRTFDFEPSLRDGSQGSIKDKRGAQKYEHREAATGLPEIDYALIFFWRDSAYDQLLCGTMGITTAGTRAAAWFISRDDHVAELKSFLHEHSHYNLDNTVPRGLEVILQLDIRDGLHKDITILNAVVYVD